MKRFLTFLLLLACASPVYAQKETLMPSIRQTVLNAAGQLVNGGCVWTYLAGTTTPTNTYTDQTGSTPNANPIQASGGFYVAYLTPGVAYKFVVENTPCNGGLHGAVIYTQDNIGAVPLSGSNVAIIGTAAQTLTAGMCAYLSDGSGGRTAGQFYQCDSTNTYSSTISPTVGLVPSTITAGNTGSITTEGEVTGLASLSVGATYYASTGGALTTAAPANARRLGQADTSTSLVLTANPPSFLALPSASSGGTSGGVVYLSSATTVASSSTLNAHGVVVGGGAGTAPVSTAAGTAGQYLQSQGASADPLYADANRILNRQVTTQTVGNTVAETGIYNFTVPGGTLGTNKTIHVSMAGSWKDNANPGGHNVVIKVKYGGTVFAQFTVTSSGQSANLGNMSLDFELTAANATNAQTAKAFLMTGDGLTSNNGAGVTSMTIPSSNSGFLGTPFTGGAVDSTANQVFVITVTPSVADPNLGVNAYFAYMELK